MADLKITSFFVVFLIYDFHLNGFFRGTVMFSSGGEEFTRFPVFRMILT